MSTDNDVKSLWISYLCSGSQLTGKSAEKSCKHEKWSSGPVRSFQIKIEKPIEWKLSTVNENGNTDDIIVNVAKCMTSLALLMSIQFVWIQFKKKNWSLSKVSIAHRVVVQLVGFIRRFRWHELIERIAAIVWNYFCIKRKWTMLKHGLMQCRWTFHLEPKRTMNKYAHYINTNVCLCRSLARSRWTST